MSYQAPVKDMLFCMTELACLEQVATVRCFIGSARTVL